MSQRNARGHGVTGGRQGNGRRVERAGREAGYGPETK